MSKNLNLISFVGVDSKTDLLSLNSLVNDRFDIECSVLFSDKRKSGRYSTLKECENFLSAPLKVKRSLHLCGTSVSRYLNNDTDMLGLTAMADRIQLNFAIKHVDDVDDFIQKIIAALSRGHKLIVQNNKSKKKFIDQLKEKMPQNLIDSEKLNLLYDGSGGFGREIKKVEKPDTQYYTGYAGGLKPENANRIVKLIETTNTDNLSYYIDMESGVRDEGLFSVTKCLNVIKNIS